MSLRPGTLATYGLGGVCGLLGLVAAVQWAGIGGGAPEADLDVQPAEVVVADQGPSRERTLRTLDAYDEVYNRPLFSEDRMPPPPPDEELLVEGSDGAKAEDEGPIDVTPLKGTLAGVIITPDLRLALINGAGDKETQVLREGMPLEGDQAGWTLTSIGPRSAEFSGAGEDEPAILEMDVYDSALPPGQAGSSNRNKGRSKSSRAEASDQGNANVTRNGNPNDPQPTSADEIRRRVAERRAQMRAEAEARAQQQEQSQKQ